MAKRLNGKGIKAIVLALVCCMLSVTAWASAEEERPTADLSVGFLSQQIWRGFELSQDSVVIEPAIEVEYMGFKAGIKGDLDTDPNVRTINNWSKTEMEVSYTHSLEMVDLTVGYSYFNFNIDTDEAVVIGEDSQEVFLGLKANTILNPTLTAYREIWHTPYWYFTFDVSHSLPVMDDIKLDLGAQVSYIVSNDDEFHVPDSTEKLNDFHNCVLSVSSTFPVAKYISVTPELNYSFALGSDSSDVIDEYSIDGDDHNFFYGGIRINLAI